MKTAQLISAQDASANITSAPADLGDLKDFSIQHVFSSGTLQGTLKLQSSNNGTSFIDVAGSSVAITAGDETMSNVIGGQYRYVRVSWTRTAGTGTLTSSFVQKETPVTGA